MQDIQELYIDILDTKVYEEIYAKQYDVGRKVYIIVTRAGTPITLDNVSASLELKKTDGTVILKSCTIQNNKIIIDIDRNITVYAARRIPYQLQLLDTSDNTVICTTTGYINIDKSTVQMDDIESSSDFTTFSDILLDISSKYSESKTYAEQARQSQISAKTSEINAKNSEKASTTSETNAKKSETNAKAFEQSASQSATAAKTSETNAKTSETNSKSSENISSQKAQLASTSETNAKTYMNNAKTYSDKTETMYKIIDSKLNSKTREISYADYSKLSNTEQKNGTIYLMPN